MDLESKTVQSMNGLRRFPTPLVDTLRIARIQLAQFESLRLHPAELCSIVRALGGNSKFVAVDHLLKRAIHDHHRAVVSPFYTSIPISQLFTSVTFNPATLSSTNRKSFHCKPSIHGLDCVPT